MAALFQSACVRVVNGSVSQQTEVCDSRAYSVYIHIYTYLESTVEMSGPTLSHSKDSEGHLVELVTSANGESKPSTGAKEGDMEEHCSRLLLLM